MVAVLNQQAIDARETLKGIHMDAQAAALESFAQGQGPVELLEAALYKAGFGVEAFAGLVTRGDSGQERHVPLPAQEWNQSAVNIQVRARAFIPTED